MSAPSANVTADPSATPTSSSFTSTTTTDATHSQHLFWSSSLSSHTTLLKCMLLHDDESEAESMNRGEVEEILEMCDIKKEWKVCEWAAGMGRLTPLLSSLSSYVYSSDFISSFCDTNRQRCQDLQLTNVQIDCIDASKYQPTRDGQSPYAYDDIDLHFVNWLLLYLDDSTAEKFVRAIILSLRKEIRGGGGDGGGSSADCENKKQQSGWIFFHESCWERVNELELFQSLSNEQQQSLLSKPNEIYAECATYYRTSYWYNHLFERCGLEVVKMKELQVYKEATEKQNAANEEDADVQTASTTQATEADVNPAYNRQMVWMLRLKQAKD